jgi:signal transduction histidine kinase/CheY-like chemotaxis protein
MTSDAMVRGLLRAAQVLLVLGVVVAAEVVTAWSDGWGRIDVVVLATVMRESGSRLLKIAASATLLATAWVVSGVSWATSSMVLVAVAVSLGVAWALRPHGTRTGADSLPGRRFLVVVTRLALVVVVASLLETAIRNLLGPEQNSPLILTAVYAALPLAIGVLLAGAVAARSVLDRRAEPHVSKLAGAFVALALAGVAVQITIQFWNSQDTTTLQTAAVTTTASFQQTVAADLDSFNARAASVPRTPVTSQSAFDKSVRSFLYGNSSISAVVLLRGGDGDYTTLFGTDRQGSAPELGVVMGAAPVDAPALDAAAASGTVFLLGVRDIPGADAKPVPSLVYVTNQAVAEGTPQRFLSVAIALPVAFDAAAVSLGSLRQQLVLDLMQLDPKNLPQATLVSRIGTLPAGVSPSSLTSTASDQTVFGDIPFDILVMPGEGFGVQLAVRSLVLGGLLLLGVLAALLMLQAANSRHRVRRYLEERETLLAAALDAAPGTVLLVDVRGRVLMSNGDPETKLARVGRPVLDVLPFDTTGPDAVEVRELVDRGTRGEAGALEHVDSVTDSALHIHLVSVSPVLTAHETSATMVVQVEDLTEQRARSMRAAQSERLRSLGTMAGGLAHDFNNLLFIISGYLQLLHDDEVIEHNQHLVRYVERAVDAAERGAEIAASLLSVARSQPLESTAIEVGSFLGRLFPLVGQAVGVERESRLVVGDGPLDVLVDSGQLSGSILNLVINSRDAMERGGTVTVAVDRRTLETRDLDVEPGDYVVISVQDDGAGMSPDVAERAFDPYFSTKGVGHGTGIGLAAVYSFARQSGGVATIETERDRGTTVSIYLPAVFSEPGREVESRLPVHGPLTRVLVVDDETALAGLIAGWLTEQGAEVRVAETPSQALRIAQEFRPQVLLTDVRLGDPDGVEGPDLARQVEQIAEDVTVVFMTGFSDRMHDLLVQGKHTLAKPFTKEALGRVLFPVDAASAPDRGGDR